MNSPDVFHGGDSSGIETRALLVALRISGWAATKLDRSATKELHVTKLADAKAGRYNKQLLAGAEELAAVTKAGAAARNAHYALTLPWADEGWRLLTTEQFMEYTAAMREQESNWRAAVGALVTAYPLLRDAARVHLGSMYNLAEYPSTDRVARKFSWSIEYTPIPQSSDVRVSLAPSVRQSIAASVDTRVALAIRDAATDCWRRLHVAVSRISERLSDPNNIFRDSLVTGTRELCDTLGRLNVTKDPALDAMRADVERLVAVDPVTLRKDEGVRRDTAREANDLLRRMGAFYGASDDQDNSSDVQGVA